MVDRTAINEKKDEQLQLTDEKAFETESESSLFHNIKKDKILVSIGSGVSMLKVSPNGKF